MKSESILTAAIVSIAASLLAASPAPAQAAISFHFGGGAGDTGNAMAANDLAGAPDARVAHWNNVTGMSSQGSVGTLPNGPIVDSNGAVVNKLAVTVTAGNTGFGGNFSTGDQGKNDAQMVGGVFDQYDGTATTINVANIPFAAYNVYVYLRDDGATRAGKITVGSTTLYVRGGAGNPDATGAGYVRSTDTDGKGSSIAQGNYVEFTGLSGDLKASIVAVNAGDGDAQRVKIAGFEIVRAAPPERGRK